ncbi:MAG: hypothetical protein WCP03_03925, partial [Candidatus Saccharibacteria bacterium]
MEESFSQYESIVSKYKRIDRIVIASVAILVSISFLAGCILYITESINANRVRLSIYYWTLFAVSILIVILSRLLYDKFVLGKKHKLREITKSVGWGFDDTNQSCVLNSPYPTIFFKLDLPYSTAEVITVPNKPSDIYLLHC